MRNIISLCKREAVKKQKIRLIIDTIFQDADDDSISPDIESEAALLLLAAMTCKNAQPSDVFKKLHPSDDVNLQVTVCSKSPMILKATSEQSTIVQYFLIAEGQVVVESQHAADLPGLLLGAYFVFNMAYPERLKPLYFSLKFLLFERTSEKMSAALRGTLNNLSHACVNVDGI